MVIHLLHLDSGLGYSSAQIYLNIVEIEPNSIVIH